MTSSLRTRVSWPFVVVILGALLLCCAAFLLAPSGDSRVPLAPTNPGPQGSRALAQVLGQHGVSVHEADDLAQVRDAVRTRGTTLVVTDSADLSGPDLDDVLAAAGAQRVVVVDPSPAARSRMFPRTNDSLESTVYPSADAARIVVNDPDVVANAGITRGDNARLALTALGHDRNLVWVSDWQGRGSRQQGLAWPAWKTPLVWSLVLAALVLVVTRGRRFGRLATEPLPVLVRSAESTRALATLYRRGRTRDTAATALQEGTARRLARHLALPRGSRGPQDVVDALAPDRREQAACLLAPAPRTNEELIALATRLAELEKEITRE